MSEENNTPQSTGSLNIASDATTIYQRGQLIEINIADLLGNEVALRQFVNHYNQSAKENNRLTENINDLKIANAKSELQPQILIPAAVVNIVGTGLIGLATNYLTSATTRPAADWLIAVAGLILLGFGSIGPIWYSHSIRNSR